MAEKHKPSSGKRIIDITHADKTTADATSKPVIVTNRPIMRDPMMSGEDHQQITSDTPTSSPTASRMTIKPLSAPSLPSKKASKNEAEESTGSEETKFEAPIPETILKKSAEAEPEEQAAVERPEKLEESDNPEKPVVESESESTDAAVDIPVLPKKKEIKPLSDIKENEPETNESNTDGAAKLTKDDPEDTPAKEEQKLTTDTEESEERTDATEKPELDLEAAAKEIAAHDAEIQKLIESKKYFVPINSVENRKTKRFIAVGLFIILILAVAWVDVSLDAGLIHIHGIKPFTHFFST